MSVLEIRGLTKRYGDFLALDRLELTVERGESFALLGPNGAGKTTTIKLLMGLLRPTEGTASISGLDCFAERAPAKVHVGYLPDEPIFPEYLKGIEVLRYSGALHGLSPETIEARIQPLLERLQLGDAVEEFGSNYSQGMRKKLGLIAALVHDPALLILDEPTAGLDPYATRTLHELIEERVSAGKSVFLSTHLLAQAQRFCDRVAVLAGGRLAGCGTLEQLREQAGLASDASLEELFFALTGPAQA